MIFDHPEYYIKSKNNKSICRDSYTCEWDYEKHLLGGLIWHTAEIKWHCEKRVGILYGWI